MKLSPLPFIKKTTIFSLIILSITSCGNTKIEAIYPKTQKEQNLITVNIIGKDSPNRGSGVLFAAYYDGNQYNYYVITASHVVNGIEGGDRFNLLVNQKNNLYPAEIFSQYKDIDLAILKFKSKSKYSIIPLIRQKPPENHQISVSGFLYCGEESKDKDKLYQHYSITGEIDNYDVKIKELREGLKKDFLNKSDFFNEINVLNKSDLYFSNPTAIGMSGGPIINKSGQLVGVQLSTTSDEKNIKNCDYPPKHDGSLGISINKLLTKEIPPEVRSSFILEDIKIIDNPKLSNLTTTPPKTHSPIVVNGDKHLHRK